MNDKKIKFPVVLPNRADHADFPWTFPPSGERIAAEEKARGFTDAEMEQEQARRDAMTPKKLAAYLATLESTP